MGSREGIEAILTEATVEKTIDLTSKHVFARSSIKYTPRNAGIMQERRGVHLRPRGKGTEGIA